MKHLFLILSIIFTLNSWAQISTSGSIPVGAVMNFDMDSCPTGWLPRDGSCVSKTTYAKLYQAIGSRYEGTFGVCAQGYFRLADARGLFGRNAGTNATLAMSNGTKYSSGTVGSYRPDMMQGHNHKSPVIVDGAGTGYFLTSQQDNQVTFSNLYTSGPTDDGTNGTPRSGSETTPAYLSELNCIKY